MKDVLITRKLIKAVIAIGILVYFMARTTSPQIIFFPFLLCGFASVGKNLGLLCGKRKLALFFDKAFKTVFFLSWFVFLVTVCCIAVRDDNYKLILFTVPFWLGGLFFAKRKLLNKDETY